MKQRHEATTAADCNAKTASGFLFSFFARFFEKVFFSQEKTSSPDSCTQEVLFFSRNWRIFRKAVEMFLEAVCTRLMHNSFKQIFKSLLNVPFSDFFWGSDHFKTFHGTFHKHSKEHLHPQRLSLWRPLEDSSFKDLSMLEGRELRVGCVPKRTWSFVVSSGVTGRGHSSNSCARCAWTWSWDVYRDRGTTLHGAVSPHGRWELRRCDVSRRWP